MKATTYSNPQLLNSVKQFNNVKLTYLSNTCCTDRH